jgi:EmrB/QacA subfamily drug resistance transporter
MDDKRRNQVLLVLFLGVLMGALDIAIIAPALPAIQTYFGVDARALAWTFSAYVLFNLIGTPLMSKLSDMFGRRSIYVLDVALFAIGSLVVAFSPQGMFGMVLAGRALQGFGAGGIFPVASAVIGDTFPPEKRGSALGLIGAVFGIAFIIGPILGGIMLGLLGWQWLFFINIPIAVVVIVMGLRLLPTGRAATQVRFDWIGMLVLSALLAALAYGISQINAASLLASVTSLQVWPFLLATVILVVAFVQIEKRAENPVLHLELFRSRQVALASMLSAGAGLGEVSMVFIPALAIAALGISKHNSSYMLMPVVLAMAIGSPLVGRLLDRFGSKAVVMVGAGMVALGALMLGSGAVVSMLGLFILASVIIGAGLSALLGAPIRYIMLNEAPASERTAAQGVSTMFTSIGQLISSALVGAVAASLGGGTVGYNAAYLVIGVVALVMTALTFALKSRAQELATHAPVAGA